MENACLSRAQVVVFEEKPAGLIAQQLLPPRLRLGSSFASAGGYAEREGIRRQV
ncbi:MAG: hypothetical protein K0Q55_1501, partial [Verrucomicrobia bacterium]|nr:hypothetical protein [Verrucomicrobiota bacterium]